VVKKKLLKSGLGCGLTALAATTLVCVGIILTSSGGAKADPPEQIGGSDVSLSINSVINLSIFDSSSNPLANTELGITPTQSGTQSSKLNTVVVGTNAPGYNLMAKAGYLPDLDEAVNISLDDLLDSDFNFGDIAWPTGVACGFLGISSGGPTFYEDCMELTQTRDTLCTVDADDKTCKDADSNILCQIYTEQAMASFYDIYGGLVDFVGLYACVTDAFWQSPDLLYQNPTTLNPKPAIPATANTLDSPNSLANNTWGFAVPKNQAGYSTLVPGLGSVASSSVGLSSEVSNFDNNYIEESSVVSTSKYASLPGHSKTIKQTEVPTNADATTLFYAAKVDLLQTAGNYKTQITYTAVANDVPEPPEEFRFTIDTRMTDTPFADGDTPESNPAHFAGTGTSFVIPNSGDGSNSYEWLINCGDGQPDRLVSGTEGDNNPDLVCNYSQPGEYQITIKPGFIAATGWMQAFGLNLSPSENSLMIKSLDTPVPKRAFSFIMFNAFSYAKNAIGIPADFLSLNRYTCIFYYTFYGFAMNSTTAVIPTGLFAGRDKTTCPFTSFYARFYLTFVYFAWLNHANDGTPDTDINDVFLGVDFSGLSVDDDMFRYTFMSMPSLTGSAQTFINNQLGGFVPTERISTFQGTSVTDLDQLTPNWK
jgi:hypothetical protein